MTEHVNSEVRAGFPIVIWMNQPSHYQTVFFRELAAQGVKLQVYYHSDLAAFRRALGWSAAGQEVFGQKVLDGVGDALRQAWGHRNATHLVNGVWSIPPFIAASVLLLALGKRVHFHAEHPDPDMTRGGFWMLLKSVWVRLLFIRAAGLWTIGRRAAVFYERIGVPRRKIHPFLYFTALVDSRHTLSRPNDNVFRILYVGQFVEWKRVVDLLAAVAQLRNTGIKLELRLVGAGEMQSAYAQQAVSLGIADNTTIEGPYSPEEVQKRVLASSVLVLPSRFDGWGVTVNEALHAGVPVICSLGCGAAELLHDHPHWGLTYPSGDVPSLIRALKQIAEKPEYFRPAPEEVEAIIGSKRVTSRFLRVVMDREATIRQVRR